MVVARASCAVANSLLLPCGGLGVLQHGIRRWSGDRHAVGRGAALRQRRDPRCRTLDGPTFFGVGGRDNGPDPAAAALGAVAGGASADPQQAFEQLRAVLSSMDYADDSEQTVDFEDGTAEDGGQDDAAGTPGAPAVRAVYEVRRPVLGPRAACSLPASWRLPLPLPLPLQRPVARAADRDAPSCAASPRCPPQTLRIDQSGRTRRIYVRRRDLVRAHGLQPRDLRRVDPSLTPGRTPPSVTIKDDCVLINVGGVRCAAAGSSASPWLGSSLRLPVAALPLRDVWSGAAWLGLRSAVCARCKGLPASPAWRRGPPR
jgi:hypothetical protein